MRRKTPVPQRARSVHADLRRTRLLGVLALVVFGAAVVSDAVNDSFWGRHALLTSLVSSVIVVMLSVAVVNELLERRRRQRWSILAQYVMFDLIRNARMIWLGVLDVTGMFSAVADQQESIDTGAQLARDSQRLRTAIVSAVDDGERRARLHSEIAVLAEHSDEVLGLWAAVMLNADVYAEILDRHVELAGDIGWIASLLDASDPPADLRRQWRARSSPARRFKPGMTPSGSPIALLRSPNSPKRSTAARSRWLFELPRSSGGDRASVRLSSHSYCQH
jgi:hypothetical protein